MPLVLIFRLASYDFAAALQAWLLAPLALG